MRVNLIIVRDKGMMKSTSKCIGRLGQLLGALLAATLIAKWRLINFIWPAQVDTAGLLGSAVVWFYMLGSLIGVFGLLFQKWWGCVGAYGAALGATMIGIPLIPWLPRLVTVGLARTYAVIVLNAAIIVWAAVVHVQMRHARSQVRS